MSKIDDKLNEVLGILKMLPTKRSKKRQKKT